MASYPFMVQTAYNVLNDVFKQWHNEPYRWNKEVDLQAEIGGRLNQIFMLQGLGTIKGQHKWVASGFDEKQSWSRVSFEPYVTYEYEKDKTSYIFPDIVIWKDLKSGENVPDGQLWSILWACELKYGSSDPGRDDVDKLKLLIEQNKIDFGCSIRVHFINTPSGIGIKWSGAGKGHHLWICDVSMPTNQIENKE